MASVAMFGEAQVSSSRSGDGERHGWRITIRLASPLAFIENAARQLAEERTVQQIKRCSPPRAGPDVGEPRRPKSVTEVQRRDGCTAPTEHITRLQGVAGQCVMRPGNCGALTMLLRRIVVGCSDAAVAV